MAKSEIARDGHLSETIQKKIVNIYGLIDCLFALICLSASPPETKIEDQRPETTVDPQTELRSAAVGIFIDEQLERVSTLMEYATERETLELNAERRSFSLPPADATDKLIRYEAHLDRQLYRAMDQLERLQRPRRGGNVSPPLNINLGRRK
jgi:hypothetical protein